MQRGADVALSLLQERTLLPVWTARKKLVQLVKEHPTVVLIGETGSGKTTQAPQLVAQHLNLPGSVACTQPRRVAAITVAKRVSAEHGCKLGTHVGYRVRFEDCTSSETRIIYMTDGMLVREAVLDPQLRRYGVVFVDEAHERTVSTDLLLGLLKRAQRLRHGSPKPLKLIVMSATLDYADFLGFFPGSQPAYIQGRLHTVELFYTATPQESYLQALINAVMQVRLIGLPFWDMTWRAVAY
jgi:HrpA-like RNA helicase